MYFISMKVVIVNKPTSLWLFPSTFMQMQTSACRDGIPIKAKKEKKQNRNDRKIYLVLHHIYILCHFSICGACYIVFITQMWCVMLVECNCVLCANKLTTKNCKINDSIYKPYANVLVRCFNFCETTKVFQTNFQPPTAPNSSLSPK